MIFVLDQVREKICRFEIGTDKKCPEQKRRAEEDEQLFPSASGLLVTFVDKEVDEEVDKEVGEEVDDEEPFSSTPSPLLLFSGARTKVSQGATRPGGDNVGNDDC